MNWSNVRLIFLREVRDQLRDRRTLFMIAVLPLLLYPLLGMSLLQVVQVMREQATRVASIGAEELPREPALLDGGRFLGDWFGDSTVAKLVEAVVIQPEGSNTPDRARRLVREGTFQAVIWFPPGFSN